MGSLNFNPFGGNWFRKPEKRLQVFNPNHLPDSLNPFKPQKHQTPLFASISSSAPPIPSGDEKPANKYTEMLEQYFHEEAVRPDFRSDPVVDQIVEEDPIFEKVKEPTREEIEENEKWWNQFRSNPIMEFLTHAQEYGEKFHELEMKSNNKPYHKEDEEIWDALPNVMGLDGRPMPRYTLNEDSANEKFWDFARQFFFGLWGYQQRPYPPGRPIDVAQAIGYQNLEKRYYDFIMRSGGFFYKDRLGRSRGPMELIQLKTAWGAGIIDKHTFVWGEDMDEWAPIGMIYGMERAIVTWDVRLSAAATAFFHKLQTGKAPWVPLKGYDDKTYKEAQQEAIESKKRDLAVLEANGGIWPGVRIPSHALFLWASGTELTNILEADHMPNKYITKEIRKQLQKVIPRLRPWEVLSVEQAMDQITYGGQWYREPLGTFMSAPAYIQEWNILNRVNAKVLIKAFRSWRETFDGLYPGFNKFIGELGLRVNRRAWKSRQLWYAKRAARDDRELLKTLKRRPKKKRFIFW